MTINYKNYSIDQNPFGSFDLKLRVTRQKQGDGSRVNPNGEEYEGEDVIAYGCTFESAVRRLINEELFDIKDTVTMEQFIEAYRKERLAIEQLLKL